MVGAGEGYGRQQVEGDLPIRLGVLDRRALRRRLESLPATWLSPILPAEYLYLSLGSFYCISIGDLYLSRKITTRKRKI